MVKENNLTKIAKYLETNKRFIVLPVQEYEDLLDTSDPSFWQAIKESEYDIKSKNLKPLSQIIKNFSFSDSNENSYNAKSRKRS